MDQHNPQILYQEHPPTVPPPSDTPRKKLLFIFLGLFFLFSIVMLMTYLSLNKRVTPQATQTTQSPAEIEKISVANRDKIAFIRGKQIFIMNSDGSEVEQITKSSSEYGGALNWSPDKTKLSFIQQGYKCAKGQMFFCYRSYATIYDFVTKKITTITPKDIDSLSSAITWSPDSKYFAYVMNGNMVVHTSVNEKQLATTPSVIGENLQWSPYSNKLMTYSYSSEEPTKITFLTSDGSNRQIITGKSLGLKEGQYSAVWGRNANEILMIEYGMDVHMYYLDLITKSLTPFPPQRYSALGHDTPYLSWVNKYVFLRIVPGIDVDKTQQYSLFRPNGEMLSELITKNVPHPFNAFPILSWSPEETMFVMEGQGAAWKVGLNGEANKIMDNAQNPVWSNYNGDMKN